MLNWIQAHRAKLAAVAGAVSGLLAAKVPVVAHLLDTLVGLLGN